MNKTIPSKKRVNKAGDAVRTDTATDEDFEIINQWRAAHHVVIEEFHDILCDYVEDSIEGVDVIFARRHKRKNTILNKLHRYPKMKLARMDDIAGCRLVLEAPSNAETLERLQERIYRRICTSGFNHRRVNDKDKYNYIKNPKATGYRGIHDIYAYDGEHEECKGLQIEIQYRDRPHHFWATTIEAVGRISDSQPKFQQGDPRYVEAMSYASELITRVEEGETAYHKTLSDLELFNRFHQLDTQLRLLTDIRNYTKFAERPSVRHERGWRNWESDDERYYILARQAKGVTSLRPCKDELDVLQRLFTMERDDPRLDVVLVGGNESDIRQAFAEYWLGGLGFLFFLEKALCEIQPSQIYERVTAGL